MECIRSNRSRCDVLNLTVIQLKALSSIYIRLKVDIRIFLYRLIVSLKEDIT